MLFLCSNPVPSQGQLKRPHRELPLPCRLTTTGGRHTYTDLRYLINPGCGALLFHLIPLSHIPSIAWTCLRPYHLSLSLILPSFRGAKSTRTRTYLFIHETKKKSLGSFTLTRHSSPRDRLHPRSTNNAAQSTTTQQRKLTSSNQFPTVSLSLPILLLFQETNQFECSAKLALPLCRREISHAAPLPKMAAAGWAVCGSGRWPVLARCCWRAEVVAYFSAPAASNREAQQREGEGGPARSATLPPGMRLNPGLACLRAVRPWGRVGSSACHLPLFGSGLCLSQQASAWI